MTAVIVAFLAASLLCYWLKSARFSVYFRDEPNERSLHDTPIPRTGGLAIIAGIVAGWAMEWPYDTGVIWLVAPMCAIAAISIIDDLRGVSPLLRLVIHLLAAVVLIVGFMPELNVLELFFIFATIWMINLYNFMDGMDGLAGGMTLIGFAFLGTAGYMLGNEVYALCCWTAAAAATGFLLFNFPPARLFMGDAGSTTLGFLAAALSLWGIRDGMFQLWFPLLVFSPFVLDATVTLLRRLSRGEKVWQAHREHYYQRLALAGWGHKRTVTAEYLLMLASGASAMAMLHWEEALSYGLAIWVLIYALLAYRVERFCTSGVTQAE